MMHFIFDKGFKLEQYGLGLVRNIQLILSKGTHQIYTEITLLYTMLPRLLFPPPSLLQNNKLFESLLEGV